MDFICDIKRTCFENLFKCHECSGIYLERERTCVMQENNCIK